MVNTMQQVGGSLGLALFTSISATAVNRYLNHHVDGSTAQLQTLAALDSYHTVFWVGVGTFVVGAVITAAIFRAGPIHVPEPAPTP